MPLAIEFSVLGSSSGGNCTAVRCGGSVILVDAGFTAKEIAGRLSGIGIGIDEVSGVLLTHDHIDHVRGAGVLSRRHGIPIHAARQTFCAAERALGCCEKSYFECGGEFEAWPFNVRTFPLPHDAASHCGFRLEAQKTSFGLATDIGYATPALIEGLRDCDSIVLESNYDFDMLENGPYPYFLKKRIAGEGGHLSNRECGEVLNEVVCKRTNRVVLAHLSQNNNTEPLARATVSSVAHRALCEFGFKIHAANPFEPTPVFRA
ncbi:MAG: hypothetical protein CVT48_02215 [Thermoplasmata archaeon HGW-Thermoplasmata-1]|nr:MAG: hypothetical protein CVT48_02215 [Thermoplasmata archaeon HGW-Thermoplasmata-1]